MWSTTGRHVSVIAAYRVLCRSSAPIRQARTSSPCKLCSQPATLRRTHRSSSHTSGTIAVSCWISGAHSPCANRKIPAMSHIIDIRSDNIQSVVSCMPRIFHRSPQAARHMKILVPYRAQPMLLFSMKHWKRAMPYLKTLTNVCSRLARLSHIRDSFSVQVALGRRFHP